VLLAQFLLLLSLPSDVRFEDTVATSVYFLGVVVCFVLSTIFHAFSDHSPEMHKFGNELDHLGIVLVMWGTGMSNVYFSFYCQPAIRNAYFLLTTATVVGCGIFTLRPKFRQPSYRTMRFLMYLFLGASLFMPIVHGLVKFGWERLDEMTGLESFFGLGVINFSGSAVYAARIPERWFPRKFDLLGHSHNWMHVLVLLGALVRLSGLLAVVEWWQQRSVQNYCSAVLAI
jgi:adiponectin receptor